MTAIVIPSFGESIRDVRIGRLHITSGGAVQEGQEIVDLETDKLTQTMSAPISGILTWSVRGGEILPVGTSIGTIVEQTGGAQSTYERPLEPQKTKSQQAIESQGPHTPGDRGTRSAMSSLRMAISKRLLDVCRTTAMVTTFQEVDLSRVSEIREANREEFLRKFQVQLGWMSFFVHASAKLLERFPKLNSSLDGSDIITWDMIDIGVAVSTERGVVVPILRNANTMSFSEIERTIDHMAEKARSGLLERSDIEGGTFTITNGGVFGSLFSTPILNPPQSAILGMHTIQKRPVVADDAIVVRPMMYLALTYDHQVIDGKEAISFLSALKAELEKPDRLLLGL